MSRQNWAAIVYGRSFHLDFRYITVPHDFTDQDITWASAYILATTHQARNLANHPRWSLFKNNSYCIVGVTCMVRDLMEFGQDSVEVMAKDDQGRPLYVFVGYVTPLSKGKNILNFPAYTEKHLGGFKPLYQQMEKVWLVKDYDQKSRQPLLSQYQSLNSSVELIQVDTKIDSIPRINSLLKQPDKIYSWCNSNQQNNQLWMAAAKCSVETSLCLNIKAKVISNSPFLNQTITQLDGFTISDRYLDAHSLARQRGLVGFRQRATAEGAPNGDAVKQSVASQRVVGVPPIVATDEGAEVPSVVGTAEPSRGSHRISTQKLRLASTQANHHKQTLKPKHPQTHQSLPQIISTRAKKDFDLTLKQAAKVTTASQELINNFTNQFDQPSEIIPKIDKSSDIENFGFKTKIHSPTTVKKDWF
ncbi:hypothetical protein [Pleurocapsa sp. FMAR1]|uniref:hypothetical protein n=1 Tax=Pleurocapsa sp. FMAR1 TaxID=3040204 RepID=UPI0029C87CE5|nr:hypothetical protein [Pleurocapsa sp. FMAR1]